MTQSGSDTWEYLPAAGPQPLEGLVLTVLGHDRADRVGGQALLTIGQTAHLSRRTPSFAQPGCSEAPTALENRFVSRSPLALVPHRGGLLIQRDVYAGRVRVQGRPLDEAIALSEQEVVSGVVIELEPQVVLFLQRRDVGRAAAPSDDLGLLGASLAMQTLRDDLRRAAPGTSAVLLRGETGTGKELAARALHGKGPVPDGPFVALNLGAVPASVAAAELFGHEAGAFTGAAGPREGLFVQAHGGTLFLDEVAEADLDVQATLLRALEEGAIRPLGGQSPKTAKPRLVSATDADLETGIEDGRFRRALLHRLAVHEIELPPLRERREDIGRLLVHFLKDDLPDLDDLGWLGARRIGRIVRHSFSGNVRELRNLARRLAAARDEGDRALDRITDKLETTAAIVEAETTPSRKPSSLSRQEIRAALEAHGFRIATAARALRITRSSLYRLLDRDPELKRLRDQCS